MIAVALMRQWFDTNEEAMWFRFLSPAFLLDFWFGLVGFLVVQFSHIRFQAGGALSWVSVLVLVDPSVSESLGGSLVTYQ